MLDWLNGKKSYLAAVGFAALAVYYYSNGDNVNAMAYASQALAIWGIKHSLVKQDERDGPAVAPTTPVK